MQHCIARLPLRLQRSRASQVLSRAWVPASGFERRGTPRLVSIGTFNWDSIRQLRQHPPSSSVVLIATMVVTVPTHDLAEGMFVGALLSGIFFALKAGRVFRVDRSSSVRTDAVVGSFGVKPKVVPGEPQAVLRALVEA
jgi:hypothetical protein